MLQYLSTGFLETETFQCQAIQNKNMNDKMSNDGQNRTVMTSTTRRNFFEFYTFSQDFASDYKLCLGF